MNPEKIKTVEELSKILSRHRDEGKKIVLCHGVFDLLHVGHIRYFNQAKKFGDILVVTLTPDPYVNKGPERPAFTESLRAEAVASLACVDYAAINEWPTAVEAIKVLKPHFYAKGSEYKSAEKDHTKGILLEEKAIHSVGGELVFTDDITYSASHLIKRHLPVFTKEISEYLVGFSQRYRPEEVLVALERSESLKVLVVGETIIDEYHYCNAIGKSSKEPMLAMQRLSEEKFLGGILAVGNHVADFSHHVGLVSFLGDRDSYEEFIHEGLNSNIKKFFLKRTHSPTIVKKRFIENYFFTKMMEVYDMNDSALTGEDNEKLCRTLEKTLPQYDVVIVVDFGHGMLSSKAIQLLCDKSRFLAVNAQSNAGNLGYHTISRYPRADYICMAEGEARLEVRDRHGDLRKIVSDISRKLNCEKIVVTQGKFGCLCYSRKEGFFEVPPLTGTGQVVDRMGAGDAFLSLTALCVAQKAPMEIVGFVGNAVGAEAVATVGHRRSIQRAALFKHIESLMK